MSDSTSYACAAITQLRKLRTSTASTNRIDILETSPYPAYTKEQLDMRRKAEILQYNSNYQSTKQNGLTKREKYAQIVSGKYQPNITTTTPCPTTTIYTPTTNSDVPGKLQYLYMDASIPLYNYATTRTYTMQQTIDDRKCNIVTNVNVACPNILNGESNPETYIGSIYFRDGIDDTSYTFSITAPVSISFSGTNNTISDNLLDFSRNIVDFYLQDPKLIVYYNDISLNTAGISKQVVPVYSLENCIDLSLNTIDSGSTQFSGNIYIGDVIFSNINLYSQSGYVYDLYVQLSVKLNLNDEVDYTQNTYFNEISYNAIYNSDVTYYHDSDNCVASSPSTNTQQGIVFDGVSSIGTFFNSTIDSSNGYGDSSTVNGGTTGTT